MGVKTLPLPLSRPVAFALFMLVTTGLAAAGPLGVSGTFLASDNPSPFADCTFNAAGNPPGTLYVNAEVEPRSGWRLAAADHLSPPQTGALLGRLGNPDF